MNDKVYTNFPVCQYITNDSDVFCQKINCFVSEIVFCRIIILKTGKRRSLKYLYPLFISRKNKNNQCMQEYGQRIQLVQNKSISIHRRPSLSYNDPCKNIYVQELFHVRNNKLKINSKYRIKKIMAKGPQKKAEFSQFWYLKSSTKRF